VPTNIKNHAFLPRKAIDISPAGYLPGGYSRRIPAVVPSGAVPAGFADLQLLIDVTHADLRSTANGGYVHDAGGLDIAATDATGTRRIPLQIRTYNPVTGRLLAWIRFPTVAGTAATPFWLYMGTNAPTLVPSGQVWAGEQLVVQGEIVGGFASDSTAFGRHGAILGGVTAGVSLNGWPALQLPGGAAGVRTPAIHMRTAFTATFWFAAGPQVGSGISELLFVRNNDDPQGVTVGLPQISSFPGPNKIQVQAQDRAASNIISNYPSLVVNDTLWHQVGVVYTALGADLYLDGVYVGTTASANINCEPGRPVFIGQAADLLSGLVGKMALIRLSNRAKTQVEIQVERSNFITPTNYALLGSGEPVPAITTTTDLQPGIPYTLRGPVDSGFITADRNALYLTTVDPIAQWITPPFPHPPGPVDILIGEWRDLLKDVNSKFFPPTPGSTVEANVERYLEESYYSLCTGDPGSEPCTDPTAVNLIQNLATGGPDGWSDPVVSVGGLLVRWTYCDACGANGLLASVPANKT
jgi:hypothetical protein